MEIKAGLEMIKEIHLTGAFAIDEILTYNQIHKASAPFPQFYPFWQICPKAVVSRIGQAPASREAVLVVINLNDKVWSGIKDSLSSYGRTLLLQTEARIGYEPAYEQAGKFDVFMNFDPTYATHPGFVHTYAPYDPHRLHSNRDLRGLKAMREQWHNSRRVFLDTYVFRFFPRHQKASLIVTLHPQEHYQIRLRMARKWTKKVDVFGGAWPKDLPSWRGKCGDKIAVASRYRFALVMENQRQPGYVSEKLLDAFAAGAIPIYWGAPDVYKLPGAGAIICFENENINLESAMNNDSDYHRRKNILLSSRKQLFETFSINKYRRDLAQALNG